MFMAWHLAANLIENLKFKMQLEKLKKSLQTIKLIKKHLKIGNTTISYFKLLLNSLLPTLKFGTSPLYLTT